MTLLCDKKYPAELLPHPPNSCRSCARGAPRTCQSDGGEREETRGAARGIEFVCTRRVVRLLAAALPTTLRACSRSACCQLQNPCLRRGSTHRLHCLLSNIGAKHRGGVERHCWCSRRRELRRLVSEPLEAQRAATGGRS